MKVNAVIFVGMIIEAIGVGFMLSTKLDIHGTVGLIFLGLSTFVAGIALTKIRK